MRCPRCSENLVESMYEGVSVDRCSSCSGIWLDQGELQPILETVGEVFRVFTLERARAGAKMGISEGEKQSIEPCPKCSKAMLPMNFGANSGVIVDVCSGHGMWLDHGEVEVIQAIHEHWNAMRKDPGIQAEIQRGLSQAEREVSSRLSEAAARAGGKVSKIPIMDTFIGKLLEAILHRK